VLILSDSLRGLPIERAQDSEHLCKPLRRRHNDN
jgi:hypothetical protein